MINISSVGGRRFLLTVISGAGTWLLAWSGKITGDVYAMVTIATVAAYITGNVAQKKFENSNDLPKSSS